MGRALLVHIVSRVMTLQPGVYDALKYKVDVFNGLPLLE